MMKMFALVLVLFLVGCGSKKEEHFVYQGVSWSVAEDGATLLYNLKAGKPGVLRFRLARYGESLRDLLDASHDAGVDIRKLVDDELMVCAACRRKLTAKERFDLLYAAGSSGNTDNKRCPECKGENFLIFFKVKKP